MPVPPHLITAGASLLGPALGAGLQNKLGYGSAKYAHDLSANFSREMFAKQTELDNTAVQRHVKDLQAAGLNPLLAVNPGGQASTPSPLGAPASPPPVPDFQGMFSSASQLAMTGGQLSKLSADTLKAVAETAEIKPNASSARSLMDAQRNLSLWQSQERSISEVIGRMLSDVKNMFRPALDEMQKPTPPDAPWYQGPKKVLDIFKKLP